MIDESIILGRLGSLEAKILALVVEIQGISNSFKNLSDLREVLGSLERLHAVPLKIDDSGFSETSVKFAQDANRLIEEIPKLNLSVALSEIKYIGNRLCAIEKSLDVIKSKGIRNDVTVSINNNGESMEAVKGVLGKELQDCLEEIYDGMPPRAIDYIRVYLEGNGSYKKVRIAQKMGITAERAKHWDVRASVYLRNPKRVATIEKIPDLQIKSLLRLLIK